MHRALQHTAVLVLPAQLHTRQHLMELSRYWVAVLTHLCPIDGQNFCCLGLLGSALLAPQARCSKVCE